MYISANDYNACQAYLTKDYRPLGRLKDRDRFDTDEQYQVHYDAIMGAGYANEITDCHIRENNIDKEVSPFMIWVCIFLSALLIIIFNVIMSKRGDEKGYFTKHCIPNGQNVKPYYTKSFICELLCFFITYVAVLLFKLKTSEIFIPQNALGIEITFIPLAVLVAEIISLSINNSMIKGIAKKDKTK